MELLRVSDAAKLLRLSVNKTYSLIRQGVIPHTRIGGSIRIVKEELETFLKKGGEQQWY